MSDIQTRLADINARAAKAQFKRDCQFLSIIAYVWIVAIGIVFAFYSLPEADAAFKSQALASQENTSWK